jgi:hypothetical protein
VDVSALDDEAMISHNSGEDDLEDNEGAVDILERDLDEFEGDVDEDLIAATGFSVL